MIWNAVAVQPGRVFVAGPRWAGAPGPMLGVLDGPGGSVDGSADGTDPRPYPDAAWNAWRPGADPARAFVNVNSLRLDGRDGLWVVDTGAPDFGGNPLPGVPSSSGSILRRTRSPGCPVRPRGRGGGQLRR